MLYNISNILAGQNGFLKIENYRKIKCAKTPQFTLSDVERLFL